MCYVKNLSLLKPGHTALTGYDALMPKLVEWKNSDSDSDWCSSVTCMLLVKGAVDAAIGTLTSNML